MTGLTVLETALAWARSGVQVVPLAPQLIEGEKPGSLNPQPLIRWSDGGLRTEREVREFWAARPNAQLGILLGGGLGCVDVDSGKHEVPADRTVPAPFTGGYAETTKSGGSHYMFRHAAPLPEGLVGSRTTQIAGFVDVLLGGMLVVAPSRFLNAPRPYELVTDGPIPEFPSVSLALQASADWLPAAWRERASGSAPGGTARVVDRPAPAADVAEVLDRMRRSGSAGRVAAWIAEHTRGEDRDGSCCYAVGHHAWASGATPEQVFAIVGCAVGSEWTERGYVGAVRRFARKHPAGLARLLRFPEGRAADEALRAEAMARRPDEHRDLDDDGLDRHAGADGVDVHHGQDDVDQDDPGSEPAEDVPTDLIVAYEEAFAPDWSNAIHRTWFDPRTGRPTHACTPRRVTGWSDPVSNDERIRRLLRERKAYLAARGGRTVRAYSAKGLPIDNRRKFGPRGIARRIGDRLVAAAADRWVVVTPGADGTADVHLFVFDDVDDAGAERLLVAANGVLADLYGGAVMIAHPFRRDRRGDGGKVRLPEAGEVEPDVAVATSSSHEYPVLDANWAGCAALAPVRRFFLDRLVVPPTDAPRFRLGLYVAGEWSARTPSFHESTIVRRDEDVPEQTIDPTDFSTPQEAAAAVDALRHRHRERHSAFLASGPAPEDMHLQACDDCDTYARTRGIERPLPAERPAIEAAEHWGERSGGRASWASGYDPPG